MKTNKSKGLDVLEAERLERVEETRNITRWRITLKDLLRPSGYANRTPGLVIQRDRFNKVTFTVDLPLGIDPHNVDWEDIIVIADMNYQEFDDEGNELVPAGYRFSLSAITTAAELDALTAAELETLEKGDFAALDSLRERRHDAALGKHGISSEERSQFHAAVRSPS